LRNFKIDYNRSRIIIPLGIRDAIHMLRNPIKIYSELIIMIS